MEVIRSSAAALAAVLLLATPVLAYQPGPLGKVTITTSQPIYYAEPMSVDFVLSKPSRITTLGVACQQGAGGWKYLAEYGVTPHVKAGTVDTRGVSEATAGGAIQWGLDVAQPADCIVWMYDEGGQVIITNVVSFTVYP